MADTSLTVQRLATALETLGGVLSDRDLSYEVVVVGGAAMALNLASTRVTQDVDTIAIAGAEDARPRRVHVLPQPLADARAGCGRAA